MLKSNKKAAKPDKPTKDSELNFSLTELNEVLAEKDFDPSELVALFGKEYPEVYEQSAGVWEDYTIKQHTLMTLRQFERYFAKQELPGGLDKKFYRILLALHDIGKPEAIESGDKHKQHQYTQQYVQTIFPKIGMDDKSTKLAAALLGGDPLGGHLRNRVDSDTARKAIEQGAQQADLEPTEFFAIMQVLFKCDASSYTRDAGGLESLDSLFIFNHAKGELRLIPLLQTKVNQIESSWK